MLWDLIRDFFVEHIFGGYNSHGQGFATTLGAFFDIQSEGSANGTNVNTFIKLTDFFNVDEGATYQYMTLGDWLSTTATIISITIIVVLCCLFVYKIIKLIGGLIR